MTDVTEMLDRSTMGGMGLIEHLEELRRRIIYSILSVVVGFGVCWNYAPKLYEYMQRPIVKVLQSYHLDDKLVYLSPTEPFNMYIKIGVIAGIFLSCPFILYQVWMFISPGLYRHEKKYIIPFMFATVGLFLAGGYFGYRLVYPAALDFLIGQGAQFRPMITIGEYTNMFLTVILGLGLVFEMPILVFFLALMGVVNARFLWRNFRFSILIIFVIAAIITPTTDILNMCIFAAPMVVLYILSIGIAWLVHPSRRKPPPATA